MEVLECLKCKGQIILEENGQMGVCASCDTAYYFKSEKNARVVSLLNQANISRLRGDFDGAILAYQIVLKEDETDADAYWGIALSKFGIDYVEDERTEQIYPTCRRTIKHSILNDSAYLKALEFASEEQKEDFEKKAIEIDNLQKLIKEKIETEQDYDVFLCFKSTDNDGNPTEDRLIARTIFDELEKRGIRTFYSEKTLKNRLGEDYEPIIYKALYTSKIFILIATKEEYIQSPWVRNEWSRFRDRASDEGLQNSAFGVFKEIKQNHLPPIFRSQGVDLTKYPVGGYEIDIADNLETRLQIRKFSNISDSFGEMFSQSNAVVFEDKVVDLLEKKLVGTRQTYEEKIERALTYSEIGNKEKSVEILNAIIDEYPRKAMGWFYKAQLLTDNFEIGMFEFTSNVESRQETLFALENATRFATAEENEKIALIIDDFNVKLSNIEVVDEKMNSFDKALKEYLKQMQKDKMLKTDAMASSKKENMYETALDINNKKLKQLKKQIVNKNYYTKNIVLQPNLLYSFLIFAGVVILITTIIAVFVNLVKLGPSPNMKMFWFEYILMLILGISPFVIVSILKTNAKLKKVQEYIDKDKDEYEVLKQEGSALKALKNRVEKQEEEETENQKNEEKTVLKKLKANMIEHYKKLKKSYLDNDYVKLYIDTLEDAQAITLFENMKKAKQKLANYEKDISILEKQIETLEKELDEKRPKHLTLKFEKNSATLKELIKKFDKQKKDTNSLIEDLNFDIDFASLKLEKTIGSTTFFKGFLQEYELEVKKFLKPEENHENKKIVKTKIKNIEKHQFSSKKSRKTKNDKGE